MSRDEDQFSIHTRDSKKGPIFYVQFKLDNGKWTNAKSTKIIDTGKKKDYQAAVSWAQKYIDTGSIVVRERMTFEQFVDGFFDWDGRWAKEKRLRGKRISVRQCRDHQLSVKNHLIPYFGKMKLSAIDDEDIRQWQLDMNDRGLSGATINRKTVALRLILKEAHRQKYIRRMPFIEAVAENQQSRGIYTPKEVRAIFSQEWSDPRTRLANLIAASTGLRASEIVALQEIHIHEEYLDITQAWSPIFGMGPTKNGKKRIVPIPDRVYLETAVVLKANPYKGKKRFLFYSTTPDKPMDQAKATEDLKEVLKKIGITKKKRETRRLDFHSWRHTFNSLLINRRIPLQKVQSITGHLSDAMSEHYYHLGAEDLGEIRQIQEAIFQ